MCAHNSPVFPWAAAITTAVWFRVSPLAGAEAAERAVLVRRFPGKLVVFPCVTFCGTGQRVALIGHLFAVILGFQFFLRAKSFH